MRVQRLSKFKLVDKANHALEKVSVQRTPLATIPYLSAAIVLLGIADALEEVEPNQPEGEK